MCGRFVIRFDPEQIKLAFRVDKIIADIQNNYNVAPTDAVLAVVRRDSENWLESWTWGLIPVWTKAGQVKKSKNGVWVTMGKPWFNTTSEKLASQPNFKRFLKKRCVVPAWAFYEFLESDKRTKTPYVIQLESQEPMAFAAHYDVWQPPEGDPITTCSIVTTVANDLVAKIHAKKRMPVILDAKGREIWLDPSVEDVNKLASLFKPYPAEEMSAYEVSRAVNSTKNNSPELIKPIA